MPAARRERAAVQALRVEAILLAVVAGLITTLAHPPVDEAVQAVERRAAAEGVVDLLLIPEVQADKAVLAVAA